MARKKQKPLSWKQALDLFETHLRARRVSERTVYCYLIELRNLESHLSASGPSRPADVRLASLRDYQCGLLTGTSSRTGRALSAASVARVATTVSRFFTFLFEEGHLAENPTHRLERPKVPRYPPGEILSIEEVERLLAREENPTPLGVRDRTVVEVLYATGLRLAELGALDLSDLDHGERELVVRHGKGDKSRVVPLTRSAYRRVMDYVELARQHLATQHPDSALALFLNRFGQRFGPVGIANALKKLGREAGLPKTIKPHMLRRTFASHLLKAGTSVRHIQTLLGHSDLNTTAAYLELDSKELRQEILLRHPRERFEL